MSAGAGVGEQLQVGAIMEQVKRSAVRKFRKENRRIDYFPTPDAVAAIERLRRAHPGTCTRELLDMLVVEGGKSWFPEIGGTVRTVDIC